MKKKDIVTGVAGVVLLGVSAMGLTGWYTDHKRVATLQGQIAKLQQQEKRSAVLQSVSKQMEEIAYQQKDISDEQREDAILQRKKAEEMRQRSEVERQNALIAQEKAVASEQQAQTARLVAEDERLMAEHQRIKAEFSKRVADTLSYVALGRSLSSVSIVQAQLGNTELANLLAYASYLYTSRYNGDLYYPSTFQSLMTASQSKRTWSKHKGLVMNLGYMSDTDDRIVTASTYGEIFIHKKLGDQLQTTVLVNDKTYDFRDLFIDADATIYAISRTGHLVVIADNIPTVIAIKEFENAMRITTLDNDNLLLVGERELAVYNKTRRIIVNTRELDFNVVYASRYKDSPILFDDQGKQHLLKNVNEQTTSDIPVPGHVTAFAYSGANNTCYYGMSDGTIYIYDEQSRKTTSLQGHLSRISKLKMNGVQLFSSGYDGTVKLWNTGSAKIEPMTLVTANSWIMNFNFDASKQYIWIGDQDGNITQALINIPMMVDQIKKNLKRDFTPDEWNYYIGNNIPYESFVK